MSTWGNRHISLLEGSHRQAMFEMLIRHVQTEPCSTQSAAGVCGLREKIEATDTNADIFFTLRTLKGGRT